MHICRRRHRRFSRHRLRIDHFHAALQARVERALASATSQDLSFENEIVAEF